MTLPQRTLSSTAQEHLDDHNALNPGYSSYVTPEGYPRVINVTDPHPDMSATAAVGDGTTDDLAAIQNVLDWVHTQSTPEGYWVWFPHLRATGQTAIYGISAPLKVYGQSRLIGPATIKALAGFDFTVNTNTAMVELYSINENRYTLGRLRIDDLTLDCNSVASSRGLLASLQQPSIINKLRVNNFTSRGAIVSGQQAQFYETMLIGPPGADTSIGLELDGGCKFMTFEGFNVEKTEVGVLSSADGPNWFKSVHLETNGTDHPNAIGFDIDEGELWIQNGWASLDQTTQTLIRAGNSGGAASSYAYLISDFRLGSSVDLTAIDDTARSITLGAWSDFRRYIPFFYAPFVETSNSFTQPNIWTIWGDDGRVTKFGGMESADPSAVWQAGSTQTADLAQWFDSGGTKRFSVEDTGHPVIPVYTDATRPSAAGVPAGAMIFNTDDNFVNVSDGTNWRDPTGATT